MFLHYSDHARRVPYAAVLSVQACVVEAVVNYSTMYG